jgi:NhaP-type Na+/H+ or K+/H+ antiporter
MINVLSGIIFGILIGPIIFFITCSLSEHSRKYHYRAVLIILSSFIALIVFNSGSIGCLLLPIIGGFSYMGIYHLYFRNK